MEKLANARYFDLIQQALNLNEEELRRLSENGFVVTDRLTFEQFKRAYAYIYWKDLPVLVTTDALLHALHRTYDEMFKAVEVQMLHGYLETLLSKVRDRLLTISEPDLQPYVADLSLYLNIPLLYLHGFEMATLAPKETRLVACIRNRQTENITFWRDKRAIDFSQFTVRGHYEDMGGYFIAMVWLTLIDFRLTSKETGQLMVQRQALVAAHLLRDCVHTAGQWDNWNSIQQILGAFVGWTNSLTLNDLDQLATDLKIQHPLDYLHLDEEVLLHELQKYSFIPSLNSDAAGTIRFSLMGQRFTPESYIMQQIAGKQVNRAYPNPLDVMLALGNDHAATHLQAEFTQYGYRATLDKLRQEINSYSDEFWENTFYNLWLNAIRALNDPPENLAETMQAPAWRDKMLHTQLASWTQLRHDNILYTVELAEISAICEYPDGYVEPYPAFYRALQRYAQFGHQLFSTLIFEPAPMTWQEAQAIAHTLPRDERSDFMRPYSPLRLRDKMLTYFMRLHETAETLEKLAYKELARESFTSEDALFLRSIVVRKRLGERIYGGYSPEGWDGWYNELLPFDDESAQLVADIYTNYDVNLGMRGVLHIGTGHPVLIVCCLENTLYVGATFTYFEHIASPIRRLNDSKWKTFLSNALAKGRISGKARLEALLQARERLKANPDEDDDYAWLDQEIAREEEFLQKESGLIPVWTKSFRVYSPEARELILPKDPLASLGLSYETTTILLHANFSWQSELDPLIQIVQENPAQLLALPGFTAEMLEDLRQRLKENGYLSV